MHATARAVYWGIWGLLSLVVLSVVGVFVSTLVRGTPAPLPAYGQLPDFRLTNQLGQTVSLADLKGHVVVADIIFTRCPGPCLQMTKKMQALGAALPADNSIRFISLTADPDYDTPSILQRYAARFKADPQRWQFLTGPKKEVYSLARHGLKLAVEENSAASADEGQFIHSTRFIVLDRQGRLRGVPFDGTETRTIPDVAKAVEQLLKES
jgi:protein SCO1/2